MWGLGIPSIKAVVLGLLVVMIAILLAWGFHWKAAYEGEVAKGLGAQLQAAQARADALAVQLKDAQVVSDNNAKVMHDLQQQRLVDASEHSTNRALIDRLLHDAIDNSIHLPASGGGEAQSQQRPDGPRTNVENGRLADLLEGAADEARANAEQLNALEDELRPQVTLQ